MISREAVLNALANIPDPESKQDIVSANLVGNIAIDTDRVYIQVNSINPALHARKRMEEAIRFRLTKELGEDVRIECEVKAVTGTERKGRRSVLPEVTHVVAIASGKGGVGKSRLTANLAVG